MTPGEQTARSLASALAVVRTAAADGVTIRSKITSSPEALANWLASTWSDPVAVAEDAVNSLAAMADDRDTAYLISLLVAAARNLHDHD